MPKSKFEKLSAGLRQFIVKENESQIVKDSLGDYLKKRKTGVISAYATRALRLGWFGR